MKGKKKIINKKNLIKKANKITVVAMLGIAIITQGGVVFGADDPLAVINNLSTFIFSVIRAIGMILLGWGIVQIGMALKSHDPSQRANRIYDVSRWSYYNICKRNFRFNNWRIE